MKRNYSRSVTKWLLYPLLSFPALLLLSAIAFVFNHIPILRKITDFLFLFYLLIIICLPTIFASCGIPGFIFSLKALRNHEDRPLVLTKLLIVVIYLAAGFYYTYYFTYDILFR